MKMSRRERVGTITAVCVVVLSWCACAVAQSAASTPRGPSTQQERERAVAIAAKLEASPLDESMNADRAWAIQWLTDVPDIQVKLCSATLGNLGKDYEYYTPLANQLILSSAAFVIENPTQANDDVAEYSAGLRGVLRAYVSILKQTPYAKSKALDELLHKQEKGELPEFIHKAAEKCRAQGQKPL